MLHSNIINPHYSNRIKLHNSGRYVYGLRPTNSNITLLKGISYNKHYGNPFMSTERANSNNKKYHTSYKGYGTVEEVSIMYYKWLQGKYPYIEYNRRLWILEQISKNIINTSTIFLYWKDVFIGDINHLTMLVKYIYEYNNQYELDYISYQIERLF